ncbi:integrase domain-containing protein [Ralstonia nicotianae]|uniref:integrase domain-containing protein n=1 Tax=Ralstonia pseudosolanacearum TaxID=1310165 RepID=UPI002004292F|nr:integrase domain-containing protein [Ralstonia pseudosolanacearum]MCK4118373.1 Fis family transcriptional regulator [Ralstonia pseudosolanacearum]
MRTHIYLKPMLADYELPERYKAEFAILAGENLHKPHSETRASGRGLSQLSQRQRAQMLLNMAVELRQGGFAILSPYSLAEKHVRWLVRRWVLDRQLAVGSVELRLSHLRALCSWIGKANMVGRIDDYLDRPPGYTRRYVAQVDRSWDGHQIDAAAKIDEIAQTDPHVAIQMKLEAAFGLRAKESWRLRPARDLLPSGYLHVQDGTKGGRPRQVLIEFGWQYELLIEAAALAARTNPDRGSLIPATYTQERWRRRFYTVLEKHGVTKRGDGVTAHGLRHQYLQQMYERLTGKPAAIKGVRGGLDQDAHREAMRKVVEAAGHSRRTKANAYLSTPFAMATSQRPVVTREMALAAIRQENGVKLRAARALGISRTALYRLLAPAGGSAVGAGGGFTAASAPAEKLTR